MLNHAIYNNSKEAKLKLICIYNSTITIIVGGLMCDGAGARPQCALSSIYSRIANKASNLILVPFGLLAQW